MLLRNRPPKIDPRPAAIAEGFEHLKEEWIAVVRWLNANGVDYVLVGPVAAAVRGQVRARGSTAIVPAPYRRNFERLARALTAQQARIRLDSGDTESTPAKITAEKLAHEQRWSLRCGRYDLDIEARSAAACYQELLYEAGRFELAREVSVEVASSVDIERYEHLRRTGVLPEFRVTRT